MNHFSGPGINENYFIHPFSQALLIINTKQLRKNKISE